MVSWRRRSSPAAAPASCSSLSILLLSRAAPGNNPHGASARSAVSWCRRNGRGARHSIGELRRAASLSLALSACAAEACSIPSSSGAPCVRGQVDSRCTQGQLNFARRRRHSTVSAKRPVRRCAVYDEGGPRCSGLPPVPRGDEICSCGVSCLAPTPAPRGAEGLSEASALLSLWACSVCAHPYCPTLGFVAPPL